MTRCTPMPADHADVSDVWCGTLDNDTLTRENRCSCHVG
jgi:hypothetical protein